MLFNIDNVRPATPARADIFHVSIH